MSIYPSHQQQLDAAVDLGLLTRVVCHELNNLLATQRGYAGLLARENTLPADRQRWLAELGAAAQAQHALVASLQSRAWQLEALPASPDGAISMDDQSAPDSLLQTYTAVANASRQMGTRMPLVALIRLLAILDTAAGNRAGDADQGVDWEQLGGAELAELDISESLVLNEALRPGCTVITLTDRSEGAVKRDWDAMGDRILPGPDGNALAWGFAMIAGLFRQYGGTLRFSDADLGTRRSAHIKIYLSADVSKPAHRHFKSGN